tara:strand:- start:411 stop:800 length:390 start_codon:yes stop_codon:yes gene_type:complete
VQSLVLVEPKAELYFVHNLFKNKKDVIIISSSTIEFFKTCEQLSTKHIKISYFKQDQPMLGIRISKKAIPLAVYRNRLRRALRERFRSFVTKQSSYAVLLTVVSKIPAEKKVINDILLPEWTSLLKRLI